MEPNEKKIAIMVVEEKEVKKPEKKIVTVEYQDEYGNTKTHVLSLTLDQYRLMEWLSCNELLWDELEWHDGTPEFEIEEI